MHCTEVQDACSRIQVKDAPCTVHCVEEQCTVCTVEEHSGVEEKCTAKVMWRSTV